MTVESKDKLPEEIEAIGRDLAALAKKHKLYHLQGMVRTGYDSKWRSDVRFHWDSGRHGAEENMIVLQSDVTIRLDVKAEPKE